MKISWMPTGTREQSMNPPLSRVTCFVTLESQSNCGQSATNIWGQIEIIRELGEGIPSSARNIPKATILFSVLAFELGFILCHAMLFDILWSMLPFILLSISLLMSSTFSSRRLALFWISHKGHISLFSLKWHEIFSNVLMFDYAS